AAIIDAIKDCLDSRGPTTWETRFLESILDDFRVLSERQQAVLERICEKCGVEYPPIKKWPALGAGPRKSQNEDRRSIRPAGHLQVVFGTRRRHRKGVPRRDL